MHVFEKVMSLNEEYEEFSFDFLAEISWLDFILNPRRLRGSDFLMRWSQGVWSERRLIDAVNNTKKFIAIPFGPSSTAPSADVREFELYFEKLENAGLGSIKRPDVLIFDKRYTEEVKKIILNFGGEKELAFVPDKEIAKLVSLSICAVECENSLWKAEMMPQYNEALRPMRRLKGKKGLPKNAVLPTVIIKEEDFEPLFKWQIKFNIPIHIWHVFFDKAYGISLDKAKKLISDGFIQAHTQVFQAPGGATTEKKIYKIYYHYAYSLAKTLREPDLEPKIIIDKNGHILPYVNFKGGTIKISAETLKMLEKLNYDKKIF